MAGPRPQHFIIRPSQQRNGNSPPDSASTGTMVPLIAVDQLPAYIAIEGVPRALKPEEASRMTNLGFLPGETDSDGSLSCYEILLDNGMIEAILSGQDSGPHNEKGSPEAEGPSTAVIEGSKAGDTGENASKGTRPAGLANSIHARPADQAQGQVAGQQQHPSQPTHRQPTHPQYQQEVSQQPHYQPHVEIPPHMPNPYRRSSKVTYQTVPPGAYTQPINGSVDSTAYHHAQLQQNAYLAANPTRPHKVPLPPNPHPHHIRSPNPASHSNGSGTTSYCRHWCHHGTCKWGINCRYHHVMPTTIAGLQEVGLCEFPAWWVTVMEMMRGMSMPTAATAVVVPGAVVDGPGAVGGPAGQIDAASGASALALPMMAPAAAAAAARMMMTGGANGVAVGPSGKKVSGKHRIPRAGSTGGVQVQGPSQAQVQGQGQGRNAGVTEAGGAGQGQPQGQLIDY